MITEWLIGVGVAIAQWFVDLLPDFTVPPEILTLDDQVSGFFDQFSGLGVWAPWPLLVACVVIALGSWCVGVIIKLVRAIASYIPFFGGAG